MTQQVIYNRITNQFEYFDNQPSYLAVQVDTERADQAEVIFALDKGEGYEPLPLNSEDDADTFRAVELFKAQDINFMLSLDFYTEDNPHRLVEVGLR